MGKEIKINSNDLIEMANELGEFLDGREYSTAFEFKCLIADYLWKKYKLANSDYFSLKYKDMLDVHIH